MWNTLGEDGGVDRGEDGGEEKSFLTTWGLLAVVVVEAAAAAEVHLLVSSDEGLFVGPALSEAACLLEFVGRSSSDGLQLLSLSSSFVSVVFVLFPFALRSSCCSAAAVDLSSFVFLLSSCCCRCFSSQSEASVSPEYTKLRSCD